MSSTLPWRWIGLAGLLVAEVAVLCLLAFWGSASAVSGLIVRPGSASIEIAEQTGPWGTLNVGRVVTPAPSWVVVQAAGPSGTVLGHTRVPAGTSVGIIVNLDPRQATVNNLVVSLVGDRGGADVFEFSGGNKSGSGGMGMSGPSPSGSAATTSAANAPDLPLVAAGKRVSVVLRETYRSGAPGTVSRVVQR